MVQTLARCRDCGLPAKLAEGVEWRPGGSIVLRRLKTQRLVLLDVRTMEGISAAYKAEVGTDACLTAGIEAAYVVTAGIVAGFKGRLSRYGVVKKRILEAVEDYSLLLGMGRIELEKFTPGEGGSLLLRRPFDIGVVMASLTGVMEGMDHCLYACALERISEDAYRLNMSAGGSASLEGGHRIEQPPRRRVGAADAEQNICRLCGLPSTLAQLQWDEVYGMVEADRGGRRVALLPLFILDTFDRLDGGGQGRKGKGLLEEAVFRSTVESLQSGTADAYEAPDIVPQDASATAAWAKFAMRGWGSVRSDSLVGEAWRIDVFNPVDTALIAGWLRALYTVAMGREPVVKLDEKPPTVTFELV